ncbi:MAG: hypothetical protein RR739_09150 [Clostridia bacterium]
MQVKYPHFVAELAKRGMKKKAIASALGISERAFHNKMQGASAFTWEQTCAIQTRFFPDMDKDDLFATDQTA